MLIEGNWLYPNASAKNLGELFLEIDAFVSSIANAETTDMETAFDEVKGGEILTDRRRFLIGKAIKVAVAINCAEGHSSPRKAHPFDLVMLVYCAWRTDKQRLKVEPFIINLLRKSLSTSVDIANRGKELAFLRNHLFISDDFKRQLEKPWCEDDEKLDNEEKALQENLAQIKRLREENERVAKQNEIAEELQKQQLDKQRLENESELRDKNFELQKIEEITRKEKSIANIQSGKAKALEDSNKAAANNLASSKKIVHEENLKLQYEKDEAELLAQQQKRALDESEASKKLAEIILKNDDNVEEIPELIAQRADINRIIYGTNDTVLTYCAWKGFEKSFSACLASIHCKNFDAGDQNGQTVLFQVINYNHGSRSKVQSFFESATFAINSKKSECKIDWTLLYEGRDILEYAKLKNCFNIVWCSLRTVEHFVNRMKLKTNPPFKVILSSSEYSALDVNDKHFFRWGPIY